MVLIMKIQNLQQRKWYIIDNESKGNYSHENPIKFLTSSLESSLCYYSNAYILVTEKNFAPFEKCRTEINEDLLNLVQLN